MRPIPAASLGIAHGLLRAIDERGRLRMDEFVTELSLEELFPPDLENALGRMRHFISYGRAAGLVKEERGVVELTEIGRHYVRAGNASSPFAVSPQQAAWLRNQLREKHMTDSIFHGLAIGLSLLASCPPGSRVSTLDFGRSMAYLGRAGWDNENTLEIQGERHLLLLQDMELIDAEHRLTATGEQVLGELTLPVHMSLIDIAGQLNPGGPDAVRDQARSAGARADAAVEPVAPSEPAEEENGYHDVGPGNWASADGPVTPPVVPRSDGPDSGGERGPVPSGPVGAASAPDLLERLLASEAGGTITRTRAGRSTPGSDKGPPEPRPKTPAELSLDAPELEAEPGWSAWEPPLPPRRPAEAQRRAELPEPESRPGWPDWEARARFGLPGEAKRSYSRRSSRLLLIAFALAGAGGAAAAIIRWLIGGVVIPPTDAGTADDVDVTVFSAVHAAPGDALLVQVFAHLPAQAREARALATEFDADTRPRGFTSLSLPVPLGAELGFELRAPGFQVDDGLQTLKWRRRAQSVQFGITIPESARPGTRIMTLIVSRESVPVGHVKLKLTISATAPRLASRVGLAPAGDDARTYQRAFASYAREDFSEVLRRVQVLRLKRLTRLRLFQDILDIDPGERWSQRLYAEIDNCDVVLLFWSTPAHDSEWVRREVRYALDRRATEFDPPEIIPVIIEVPPCRPWPELADQHFDDAIARLIAEH